MFGLIALTLGLAVPSDAPVVEPKEFQAWFDAAARNRLAIPLEVSARAREFRYVFVGGFRGESMRGYFTKNAQELRSWGIPKKSIHLLGTSSHETVEEYSETFAAELRELADAGPEQLVLIAHSRGACDALAFALRNPEFTRDRIEAMFLIQGPFGGSGLADYVMGDGPPIEKPMRSVDRMVARAVGGVERRLIENGKHGSVAGLTHEASRAFWCELIEANADALPVVGPRVFYVEGETEPSHLKPIMRATAAYLTLHYGPNDGVVVRGEQTLPEVGTSLGVFDAGHRDLTRKGSSHAKRSRKALIQAIMMAVGRSAE